MTPRLTDRYVRRVLHEGNKPMPHDPNRVALAAIQLYGKTLYRFDGETKTTKEHGVIGEKMAVMIAKKIFDYAEDESVAFKS